MATAPSPNDLTRQQLDELDALLQRMLNVPLTAVDPPPPAPTAGPPTPANWRADPPAPGPVAAPHLAPAELPRPPRAPKVTVTVHPAAEALPAAPPVPALAPPPEPAIPVLAARSVAELPPAPAPELVALAPAPAPVEDEAPIITPPARPAYAPRPTKPAPRPQPTPPQRADAPRSVGTPHSPVLWPLVAFDQVVCGLLGLMGPPGWVLRSGFGKNLLGLAGVGLMAYTAAHVAADRGLLALPFPLPWPR